MFDISRKSPTLRSARAEAMIAIGAEALTMLYEGKLPKGDPLPVARVAAIQAVKRTSDIIPYCHPIPVEHAAVEFDMLEDGIRITVSVVSIYRTGVEMEAMTGASVAALTIYDMMKMVDAGMEIRGVRLLEKRGGKSDRRDVWPQPLRAGVLVMSDSIHAGLKGDASGLAIQERLEAEGLVVEQYTIVPDEIEDIRAAVLHMTDTLRCDVVLLTGGTGFSPRDCTPEALSTLLERDAPGIAEAIRAHGQERTPYAMLSRSVAGIRGKSIVLALPGSRGGVRDALDAVFPSVLHAFKMLWMKSSPVHAPHPPAHGVVASEAKELADVVG